MDNRLITNKLATFKKLESRAYKLLLEKHQTTEISMNVLKINDIVYDGKSHAVAVFKEHLIVDDCSEFLKRFYKRKESQGKLPKIFEFYEIFSKIFANYIALPEAKYIYKNIQRKQKMIDNLQNENTNTTSNKNSIEDKIFNTEAYDSILNQSNKYNENKTAHNSLEDLFNMGYKVKSIQSDSGNNAQQETSSIVDLINCIEKCEKEKEKGNQNDKNICINVASKVKKIKMNKKEIKIISNKINKKIIQEKIKSEMDSNRDSSAGLRQKLTLNLQNLNIKNNLNQNQNLLKTSVTSTKPLFNKIILSNRGIKTERPSKAEKVTTERPSSHHDTINNKKPVQLNNFLEGGKNYIQKAKLQSKKCNNNGAANSSSSSAPKTAHNNINSNFNNNINNIINNYQATIIPQSTQINIYNNVSLNGEIIFNIKKDLNKIKNELYVNTYSNDVNKLKKKMVSLVNDSNHHILHKKIASTGNNSIMGKTILGKTINTNNASNIATGSVNNVYNAENENINFNTREFNLRSIIHKEMFAGEKEKETARSARVEKINSNTNKNSNLNNNALNNISINIKDCSANRKTPLVPSLGLLSNLLLNSSNLKDKKLTVINKTQIKNTSRSPNKNIPHRNININNLSNVNKISKISKINSTNSINNSNCNSSRGVLVVHRTSKSNINSTKQNEKKTVSNNNTLTPNPGNKSVLKINNFFEVVRNTSNQPQMKMNSARAHINNKNVMCSNNQSQTSINKIKKLTTKK